MVVSYFTQGLKTPCTPYGILDYEFAGSGEQASAIHQAWGESGKRQAAFQLGIDFLFIAAYVTAISIGCLRAPWPRLALWGAWLVLVAGALDCLENVMLLGEVYDTADQIPALIARYAAIVKFALATAAVAIWGCAEWSRRNRTFAIIVLLIGALLAVTAAQALRFDPAACVGAAR